MIANRFYRPGCAVTSRRIYFAKPIGMDGPIKIGCSSCPDGRLATLMAWSPWPLEIIGSVPGAFSDETFLHERFADSHSHLEWFFSSPELRETIDKILAAGTVDVVKGGFVVSGKFRRRRSARRTEEWRRHASLAALVRTTARRLRAQNEDGNWRTPYDIHEILGGWQRSLKRDNNASLSPQSLARIEEYLANPEKHSVAPWHIRGEQENAA